MKIVNLLGLKDVGSIMHGTMYVAKVNVKCKAVARLVANSYVFLSQMSTSCGLAKSAYRI